jgi:hypothetical protein
MTTYLLEGRTVRHNLVDTSEKRDGSPTTFTGTEDELHAFLRDIKSGQWYDPERNRMTTQRVAYWLITWDDAVRAALLTNWGQTCKAQPQPQGDQCAAPVLIPGLLPASQQNQPRQPRQPKPGKTDEERAAEQAEKDRQKLIKMGVATPYTGKDLPPAKAHMPVIAMNRHYGPGLPILYVCSCGEMTPKAVKGKSGLPIAHARHRKEKGLDKLPSYACAVYEESLPAWGLTEAEALEQVPGVDPLLGWEPKDAPAGFTFGVPVIAEGKPGLFKGWHGKDTMCVVFPTSEPGSSMLVPRDRVQLAEPVEPAAEEPQGEPVNA